MGMCCSDDSKDPFAEDFLKEQEEQVHQHYSKLVKPHLVASMSKIYITQRPHSNVIPEEDPTQENSTIPNSYLRYTTDGISKRSEDISFNYESQINGSILQFNYIFGSKLVLINVHTKYLLHSHCVKSTKIRKANEVTVTQDLSKQSYLEWILFRDQGGPIQSGDKIQIEHALTKRKLCCTQDPMSKQFEVCCDEQDDEWRIEVLNKDGIVRVGIGSYVKLIHGDSDLMLLHVRKRALLSEHNRVKVGMQGKFCIWQVMLSEQS